MAMALRSVHMDHGMTATGVAHGLSSLFDTLAQWHQRAMSRRELAQLDDRMLRDIGVTQVDVEREVSKHFWQP